MQRYQISYRNSNLHNTYNSVVRTPGYVPVVSINRQFHSTELSCFIYLFSFFFLIIKASPDSKKVLKDYS